VLHASVTIPRIHAMLDGGKICVLGDEKTLFVVLKGDDSVAFYSGHRADEDWSRTCGIDFSDKAQVMTWFRETFAGWDAWTELFEHASMPLIPRPQYCAPVDQQWTALPNITLLGDAAHVMPPYAGEGVNMAMLDALELAECLLDPSHRNIHAAITAYEPAMCARNAAAATQSLEFTAMFHSREAIPFFIDFFRQIAQSH
jgi:2-polyprenyl-6-methoxyphenol hydroxylase-like FAD-dependent oxidoreductase